MAKPDGLESRRPAAGRPKAPRRQTAPGQGASGVPGVRPRPTRLSSEPCVREPLPPEVALLFSLLMKQMDRRAAQREQEAA